MSTVDVEAAAAIQISQKTQEHEERKASRVFIRRRVHGKRVAIQELIDPLTSTDRLANHHRSSGSLESQSLEVKNLDESSNPSLKRSNSWPSGKLLPCQSTLQCGASNDSSNASIHTDAQHDGSIIGDEYSNVDDDVWDRDSIPEMHYDIKTILHEFKEHAEQENYSERWLEFIKEFLMPLSEPLVYYVMCSTNRLPTRFRSCHRIMKDETELKITATKMVFEESEETEVTWSDISRWSLLFMRKATLYLSLPYNHGQWAANAECAVCFRHLGGLTRLCCGQVVCENCLNSYFIHKVENEGRVQISCPACVQLCERAEISFHLPSTSKDKFYRFLVDANNDPNKKTCPRCSHVTQRPKENLTKVEKKYGLHVTCEQCNLQWCFNCQAPVHSVSCSKYRTGDILLRQWTKQFVDGNSDTRNARRCPNCNIFIQKSDGCNHMQCSCGKRFCYACGCSMRSVALLGNHSVRLSVLGCSKSFLPNRPHLRRFVRGSILSAGIAVSPILLVGGLGVGILVGLYVGGRFIGKKAKRRIRKIGLRHIQMTGEIRIEHVDYAEEPPSPSPSFGCQSSTHSSMGAMELFEDDAFAEIVQEITSIELYGSTSEREVSSHESPRTSSNDYITSL